MHKRYLLGRKRKNSDQWEIGDVVDEVELEIFLADHADDPDYDYSYAELEDKT